MRKKQLFFFDMHRVGINIQSTEIYQWQMITINDRKKDDLTIVFEGQES
jgi:hypothetical protein